MFYRLLIAVFALMLVTACGSSSSGNDAPPPPPPANDSPDDEDGDDSNGDDSNGDDTNGDDTNGDDGGNDDEGADGNDDEQEPEEPVTLSFDFAEGIDDWHINGTGNTTTQETDFFRIAHDAEQGAMTLEAKDWSADNWRLQARYELGDGVDLSDATVTMELDIPQAYLDDGNLAFQLILDGNSGSSYGDYISLSAYDAETQRVELDLGVRDEDLSFVGLIAIQFAQGPTDGTITDPVAIRSLTFYLATEPADEAPEEEAGDDNQLTVDVDGGWSNDGSAATLSYDEGVVVTPGWAEGQHAVMKVLEETADFTGATVTWVIDVPEAYITDGELVIQPYVQQNADPYASVNDGSIPGGWNTMGALEAGENTIVHGPFVAPPEDIGRVGIWLNPNGLDTAIDEDIVVRSATITFPGE